MNSTWPLTLCAVVCLAGGIARGLDTAVLDLSLEPPPVITAPGPEYEADHRPGNMIIGMDRTPRGRLWAAWVGNGDSANGFFMLASSDDDGTTWSRPRLVIDPQDGELDGVRYERRALVGNLWTDPLGRLWCFFDQSLGYFDGRAGDWFIRCDDPDAAEPTWTAPERFADGCTLNKPTVLSDGDWLVPVSLWTRDRIHGPGTDKEAHRDLDPIRMANVFASTDRGKTWTRRGGVVFPGTDFDEHMIVERRDGSLWMLARTKSGISESFSADKGATWSEPRSSAIRNPSARFFIRRLASGNLLLVKNGPVDVRLPRRSSLTAFLSGDDGRTWGRGLLLDDRAEVSYPDGFQSPDGVIHILYDWNRHTDAEILHVAFREDDIGGDRIPKPTLVNKALAPALPRAIRPDPKWTAQAREDARLDLTSIPYDGSAPDTTVSDTMLRELPDASWILSMLVGGGTEPAPANRQGVVRSSDRGKTWTPLERFDLGFPPADETIRRGTTELMILDGRCTLFLATHARHGTKDWRSWHLSGDDSFANWSRPAPLPGRLHQRTCIGKHVVCRDGRIMAPFWHAVGPDDERETPPLDGALANPRHGVIVSTDGGTTWSEHGDVRLTPNDRHVGRAESALVEHPDGRLTMVMRGDGLGGMLWKAESQDGGRNWPEFASVTPIPDPGGVFTLYGLGGDRVAMLRAPNPKRRSSMALWISFNGMKTWPYQRVLRAESRDGPQGLLNRPDGFVSEDGRWLHFAFDDGRRRAVQYSAQLPPPE